jgi:lysophospholipase
VRSFDEYLEDVQALRERAAADASPGPLFLVGHSMGGLVALLYALRQPEGLSGLALSSPLLALHPRVELPRPVAWIARALGRVLPGLRVQRGVDPSRVSRSPETVAAYAADPLIFRTTTFGWYAALAVALERAWAGATELRLKTWLAWAGADRVVDPLAPARWAARTPAGRVTSSERPGHYHELFNEPERDDILRDLCDWLDRA